MADEAQSLLETIKRRERDWPTSLLALDVRPQRYGYAVFEGPSVLLDWGIRRDQMKNSIDALLDRYAPEFIVVRRRKVQSVIAASMIRVQMTMIITKARQHSTKVRFINAKKIRHLFQGYGYGNRTKHEIASLLADWFQEIAWKLPKKRRAWESENHNTVIFDSVATGVAFFAHIT